MKELTAFAFVVLVIVLYAGVLLIVPMAIDEVAKKRRRKIVGELISEAHSKLPLTRKQIEILATDHRLTSRDTQILLRNQFSEAVKARDEQRGSRIDYFQGLYEKLEKDEPFEDLPSDVRLHLERIRESIGQDKDSLMQPLASQLQDLNSTNRRKEKGMWILTIASFVFGVVGVIFAAISYLPSHSTGASQVSAASVEAILPALPTGLSNQSNGSVKSRD